MKLIKKIQHLITSSSILLQPCRAARSSFLLPKAATEIPPYKQGFEQAVAFTKSCGVEVSDGAWLERDILASDGALIDTAVRAAGVQDMAKSAGQCLKWCHFIAPFFERQLGCKVWMTVGQIWKDDTPVYDPSWDDMRRWSSQGIQFNDFQGRKGFNLHAWLTLQSGEIIDPTILSTLAAFGPHAFAKVAGAVVWGRDPKVLNFHRYFPMGVGLNFAEAIAKHSVMPLLARNTAELHQVAAMLVRE